MDEVGAQRRVLLSIANLLIPMYYLKLFHLDLFKLTGGFINYNSYMIADLYIASLYYIEYTYSDGTLKLKGTTKNRISDLRNNIYKAIEEKYSISNKSMISTRNDRYDFYKSMPKDKAFTQKLADGLALLLVDLYEYPKEEASKLSIKLIKQVEIKSQNF